MKFIGDTAVIIETDLFIDMLKNLPNNYLLEVLKAQGVAVKGKPRKSKLVGKVLNKMSDWND